MYSACKCTTHCAGILTTYPEVHWGIIGFYIEIRKNIVKQNLKNDFFFIFEWKMKNTLHNKKGALCYVYTNFSDFIFIGGYNERKFCKKGNINLCLFCGIHFKLSFNEELDEHHWTLLFFKSFGFWLFLLLCMYSSSFI